MEDKIDAYLRHGITNPKELFYHLNYNDDGTPVSEYISREDLFSDYKTIQVIKDLRKNGITEEKEIFNYLNYKDSIISQNRLSLALQICDNDKVRPSLINKIRIYLDHGITNPKDLFYHVYYNDDGTPALDNISYKEFIAALQMIKN